MTWIPPSPSLLSPKSSLTVWMGGRVYADVITEFFALVGSHLISMAMESPLIIGVNRIIRLNLKNNQSLVWNGHYYAFQWHATFKVKNVTNDHFFRFIQSQLHWNKTNKVEFQPTVANFRKGWRCLCFLCEKRKGWLNFWLERLHVILKRRNESPV